MLGMKELKSFAYLLVDQHIKNTCNKKLNKNIIVQYIAIGT